MRNSLPDGAHGRGGHLAQSAVRGLAGTVAVKAGLAAGTLELRFVERDGAPVVGQEVRLGHSAGAEEAMAFVTSRSDKDGSVRFAGLETGEQHEYVAMIDREACSSAALVSACQGITASRASCAWPARPATHPSCRCPVHPSC